MTNTPIETPTTTIAGTEIDAAIATLERVGEDLTKGFVSAQITKTSYENQHMQSARWISNALMALRVASKLQAETVPQRDTNP